MKDKAEIQRLENKLRNVILGTCNVIGCRNCPLEKDVDGDCEATFLQNAITRIELAELQKEQGDE